MKGSCLASLALAFLLTDCGRPVEAPARQVVRLPAFCAQKNLGLTVVGDSLARGWGASAPQKDFAWLIYDGVRRTHPKATLRNLGMPGATTDEIAAKEVSQIHTGDCSLVVVISGANDVQKLYTPRHFERSYDTLLGGIRTRLPHAALVVVGLPDVSLSPRIPWILKPLESRLSRDGSASIAAAANHYGAAFVPLYDLSRKESHKSAALLSADGIHPNDAGYRIMAGAALVSVATVLRAQ